MACNHASQPTLRLLADILLMAECKGLNDRKGQQRERGPARKKDRWCEATDAFGMPLTLLDVLEAYDSVLEERGMEPRHDTQVILLTHTKHTHTKHTHTLSTHTLSTH